MSTAIAIIGAGYGDESKGNAVSYMTKKLTTQSCIPLVVRGNGGCQAGHTVVAEGGKRHVFGHIGAGTFAGADTYLASNFIVNPLVFAKELEKLRAITSPVVYAHPSCRVTTIYDMALNSLIELARGTERHGSCGLGINETVTRDKAGFHLDFDNIKNWNSNSVTKDITRIRDKWLPRRLSELDMHLGRFRGMSDVDRFRASVYFASLDADPAFVTEQLRTSVLRLPTCDPRQVFSRGNDIIIEGAQGLMLDEVLGTFPHVTRSITGLPAAIRATHECGQPSVQPVYVTRSYLTRHGAGPLDFEGAEITNGSLIDTTNVTNEWQGTLRYAPLDPGKMSQFIEKDLERGKHVAAAFGITLEEPVIFLSCMDQLQDFVTVVETDINCSFCKKLLPADLPRYIEKETGIPVRYISYGPTASDVTERE